MAKSKDVKDSNEKNGNWFKRHKILTVILAIIVLVVLVNAAGGDKQSSNTSSTNGSGNTNAENSSDKQQTVGLNTAARDGKFEFVVKSVKCGVPSVSDSTGYITKSAQGQYCLVDISVKNVGDKQQIFMENDQKLLNASNVEYSSDTTATLYNSNNSDVFVNEINPGNTVEGTIVYDIPKDQTPVTAELHDSSFSNGVKVKLQ